MTPETVVEYLSNLAIQYRLVERATASCNTWFENEGGQIEGWTAKDLRKQFFSHALVFKRNDWDIVYIDTRLDLLLTDGKAIGYYRLITTLNGEPDDDYLVLDLSKAEYDRQKSG